MIDSPITTNAAPVPSQAADGDAGHANGELNGAVVLRTPRRGGGTRRRITDGDLRAQLVRLHRAAEEEVDRRRSAAELTPADALPVPVRELSSIRRELPRLAAESPRVLGAAVSLLRDGGVVDAARGVAEFVRRQRELGARTRHGDEQLDDFGFDQEWTESLLPFVRWLYHVYWRVEAIGTQHVPSKGRALLVSNHAGVLPWDGAMIRTALMEDHPARRHARALILNQFFGMPVAGWFLRRTGNTLAHPGDAQRLLDRDELVLVFPEGAKGTGKPYKERYRLRRFGRGGFIQIALRTGSPIIPVSVVGSEEVHPMIADFRPLSAALGLPYVPVTPTFPLLGLLGFIPLPSSWVIEFHKPIQVKRYGRDAADDAALIMQLSDQVRDTIQEGLFRNLERRGSVFA